MTEEVVEEERGQGQEVETGKEEVPVIEA